MIMSLFSKVLKRNILFYVLPKMNLLLFSRISALLLLALTVVGTMTIASSSINQAWADVIEGTDADDFLVGTPEDDIIDSKGGNDGNIGDIFEGGDASGDDII